MTVLSAPISMQARWKGCSSLRTGGVENVVKVTQCVGGNYISKMLKLGVVLLENNVSLGADR